MIKHIAFIISISLLMITSQPLLSESLYKEKQYTSLIADHVSYEVGKTLTVLIYEQASASTSAGTDLNASMAVGGSINGIGKDREAGIKLAQDADSSGQINRAGRLMASVSVNIDEVLDSGELRISGEQSIEFNEEAQHIKIKGRVRPQDISAQNTVLSTRLANSEIVYQGDGILGEQQKPGWITRFFQWLF